MSVLKLRWWATKLSIMTKNSILRATMMDDRA